MLGFELSYTVLFKVQAKRQREQILSATINTSFYLNYSRAHALA
jgi:hypothetical protein